MIDRRLIDEIARIADEERADGMTVRASLVMERGGKPAFRFEMTRADGERGWLGILTSTLELDDHPGQSIARLLDEFSALKVKMAG